MPYTFERTVLMPFEPPAAKPDLDNEHDKTEQQAGRITRYGLAFCPSVMFCQIKFHKSPSLV